MTVYFVQLNQSQYTVFFSFLFYLLFGVVKHVQGNVCINVAVVLDVVNVVDVVFVVNVVHVVESVECVVNVVSVVIVVFMVEKTVKI